MYRQRPFRVDDVAWCRALAEANPFATVVAGPGGHDVGPARVGHVPVVLDGEDDVLAFHVAVENPLADLDREDEVLVVFHGPHAEVSASWYVDPDRQVPTWDHETVHATGRVIDVLEPGPARQHVAEVSRTFEGPDGWSVDHAPGYVDKILPALRAFRVQVDRWEGQAKLSQNKSDEDRLRVAVHLRQSSSEVDRAVGRRVAEELGEPAAPVAAPAADGPKLADFELRMPTPDDCDLFLEAVARSARTFRNYVDPPRDAEQYEAWLARVDATGNRRNLAFFRGRLIGMVNLQNVVYGQGLYATLGYLAMEGGEGRGLMRRAVALGVDLAFDELGLHRVEAGIQPTNDRSVALVRALGFRYEGLLKRLVKVEGEFRDHELWATDTEDWPGAAAIFGGGS